MLDPCEEPFGYHLEVLDDGPIRGLTPPGVALMRIWRLDRPKLTAFRRKMLEVWRTGDGVRVGEGWAFPEMVEAA